MKQNFGLGGPEAPTSVAGGDAGGAICSGAVAAAAVRSSRLTTSTGGSASSVSGSCSSWPHLVRVRVSWGEG